MMTSDNLLATLEQTLKQTKAVRARLFARLSELETEAGSLRSELRELDHLTAQTEQAMYRLLAGSFAQNGGSGGSEDLDERSIAATASSAVAWAPLASMVKIGSGPSRSRTARNRATSSIPGTPVLNFSVRTPRSQNSTASRTVSSGG